MKILFISRECCTNPLAWMMSEQGDEVSMWIKEKEYREIGDGFIKKLESWEPVVKEADLIICDDVEFGDITETLRKQGKHVIGGTRLFDKLEKDRGAGQKMFKALGMNVLPTHDFKTFEEAIAFTTEHSGRIVIKVNGEAQNNKMLTYVGQDDEGQDIVPMLEHIQTLNPKNLEGIELQEHAEGIEVACGGFFNGNDFISPVEINFEYKRLMNDDVGPNTAEVGTGLMWIDKKEKIYKTTIGKFVPLLRKEGYRGHFDINCIVNEDGIHPLEMTCRFGYPTLNVQMETIQDENWADFFYRMSKGELKEFSTICPYGLNVVISAPPCPYDNKELWETTSKDMPVILKGDMEGIYPADVKLEDGQWRITGNSGFSVVVSAGGESFEEARQVVYERRKNVIIPNNLYRTDIGCDLSERIRDLKRMKLLRGDGEEEPKRPIVIKCGGIYLDDPDERDKMIRDVITLAQKEKVILVHGGGDEITRKMEDMGKKPEYQDGRRFTSASDIELVEDTLRDINHDLVKDINEKGLVAVSHSGHGLFTAQRIKDMGVVGIPIDYDKEGLERILEDEAVSIFYSVTPDTEGKPLNVNADDFGGFLALWSGAKQLIYLNEDGGVLDDDKKVIPEISIADMDDLEEDGTLSEGKFLKASYAKMLLENGAESVKISETIFGQGTEFTVKEREAVS